MAKDFAINLLCQILEPLYAVQSGRILSRPPDFGRSVNPISTRGTDYAPHFSTRPSDFQTKRHPCNKDKPPAS